MRRTIVSIVGTRPNFMKTAPVVRELVARPDAFRSVLIHTGQHYDRAMSDVFFEQLGVGDPDHMLDVGSGSHAVQTARVMERLEPLLSDIAPDLVLVPGDVNSTMAAALVASKLRIPIAHLEAGLRSQDRSMPEEINRVVTDQLSDLLFVHSPEAVDHLVREGRHVDDIFYVGNTMIDTLVAMRERVGALDVPAKHGLDPGGYIVVTLHRPALVDDPDRLAAAMRELSVIARGQEVIFPIHPRTRGTIEREGIEVGPRVRLLEPLGYLDFLGLVSGAAGVLTDSGGIQEETTFLGVPCFTLRDNTERPVTCELGTNVLLGLDPARIAEVPALIRSGSRATTVPPWWDGAAAERVVDVLAQMDDYRRFRGTPSVSTV